MFVAVYGIKVPNISALFTSEVFVRTVDETQKQTPVFRPGPTWRADVKVCTVCFDWLRLNEAVEFS